MTSKIRFWNERDKNHMNDGLKKLDAFKTKMIIDCKNKDEEKWIFL